MKAVKYSFVIMLVMFMGISCQEENLDLDPLSETEASFFDEEIDYERAVRGVYAKLTDFYWFNSNNPIHDFWLLPGDDLTSIGGYSFEIFSTLQPGDGKINYYYDRAYQLINRTNVVLQKIAMDEERETVYDRLEMRKIHKGEALFFRGWMFFQLWNYYGTAPVITERIETQDQINPSSSDGIELLDQAIADFTEAANLLPADWDATNRGRVTRSSANGMLGKALVFKGSWTGDNASFTQAISAFDKITDKALVDNYNDNFSIFHENNDESLFEFQASQPNFDNVWLSNDFGVGVGSTSAYYGYFNDHWSFWAHTPFIATDKLVNAIDPDDPRLPYIVDPSNNRIQKYLVENQLTQSGVASLNNPRILRYADVLLLKAEAMNETGNTSGAITLINQVRTRARNMDTTGVPADRPAGASQDQVRQWIMDERFVELAAEEGHRWLDLRRWHKAGHINLSNLNFDSINQSFSITMPKHLLYPIPTNEIDLNKNVVQNEGY